MNLADYLSELISQYDEVSIPGLGYFVRERVNGYYDEGNAKFYPPFHQVKFVQEPKDGDTFAQHVADKKHISLASSKYFTEKFVGKIKEQAATGQYPIADIGLFQTNENHELVFTPSDKILVDADFYGFEPIGLSKKERIAPKHHIETFEVVPTEEPVIEDIHTEPSEFGFAETATIQEEYIETVEAAPLDQDVYAEAFEVSSVEQNKHVEDAPTEEAEAQGTSAEPVDAAPVEPPVLQDEHVDVTPPEQDTYVDPFEEALAKALAELNADVENTPTEQPVAENSYAEPVDVAPVEPPPVFHEPYVETQPAEETLAVQNEYMEPVEAAPVVEDAYIEEAPAGPSVPPRPVSPYLENPVYYYGDEDGGKQKAYKVLKIVLIILIVALVAFGVYQFFSSAFQRLFINNHNGVAIVADKIDTLTAKTAVKDSGSIKDTSIKTAAALAPVAAAPVDTARRPGYTIIIERFKKQAKIDAEVVRFRAMGIAAMALTKAEIPGNLLKVSVGRYATYNDAEAAKRALVKAGKIGKDSQIEQLKTQK